MIEPASQEFDVLIVGAGSAGCAAAWRLASTTDLRIGLVEAGPDYGAWREGQWPDDLVDPKLVPVTHDWDFVTERGDGTSAPEPRAKVLGGCSAHNHCAAVWGLPADYERWSEAGNPGWRHADLAPFVDWVEACQPEHATPARGRRGALPTYRPQHADLAFWQRVFLQTAMAAGFQETADLSLPEPAEGVAPFHTNLVQGMRCNAAFAFIDPARDKPNLAVLSLTLADRLSFELEDAVALIYQAAGGEAELRARAFLLTAGVYGSPAILLRSGIGPAAHLDELGITTQTDAAGVGQNLHDHPGVRVRFSPAAAAKRAVREDLDQGRLFQSQVILRARSSRCPEEFDLHVLPFQATNPAGAWEFDILAFNMNPASRGEMRLQGTDPALPPLITPRWLSDPDGYDIAVLADGVHVIRQLATVEPLASVLAFEMDPGTRVSAGDDLQRYIRETVDGYAHPVGTCKMGPSSDAMAVVDAAGRVHGTSNVYVADASIIPGIPRANTNLTCMLIGMKVADAVADALVS